jgi:anti-sigma-K factor RskA
MMMVRSNGRCNGFDHIEIYVLGGLSDEEIERFEEHLAQCADCQQQVDELKKTVDLFPFSSEPVPIPAGMKERILTNVLKSSGQKEEGIPNKENKEVPIRQKASQYKWRRFLTASLTAAIIFLSVYSIQLQQKVEKLKGEIEENRAALNQPSTTMNAVTLSPQAENIVAEGLATIIIDSKGTHLLVQAKNLPELQGTEAYQVWLLKNGQPVNAGTFLSEDGNGALYFSFEPTDYDMIAITLEPDTQGDTPRGNMILTAPLKSKG